MRIATAICLRYEHRPADVSEVSCKMMWKGYILLSDDFVNLQTLTPCGRRSFARLQWLHFHVERV